MEESLCWGSLQTNPPRLVRFGGTPMSFNHLTQNNMDNQEKNAFPQEKRCTCGNTTVRYYPDENQHEPDCWDCYDQAMSNMHITTMESSISPLPAPLQDAIDAGGHWPNVIAEDDLPF